MTHERNRDALSSYFDAARRKVEIANYHLECLLARLKLSPLPTHNGYPPVEVQAHFEGILFSIKAEIDQVTELSHRALACPYKRALEQASNGHPAFEAWLKNPLFSELTEVRRLAAHHAYVKRPSGPELRWRVEEVGSAYTGARELDAYCQAVVGYGEELIKLIELVLAQTAMPRRL